MNRQVEKDSNIAVLMNDIFKLGMSRMICDVFFCTNHIILVFKEKTPDVLLKYLAKEHKAILSSPNGEYGFRQFICNV